MVIIKRLYQKMKFLVFVTVVLALISCKQKNNIDIVPINISDPVVTDNGIAKHTKKQIEDSIHLNFIDEDRVFTVRGSIDSLHPLIYVKFENDDLGVLKAKVIPLHNTGNIRFNQIVFPDRTSDGPFGLETNLELKQTGNHVLIIGHSLMAENPYVGKFKVELQIIGK